MGAKREPQVRSSALGMRREKQSHRIWLVVVPFDSCGEEWWTTIETFGGIDAKGDAEARAHWIRGNHTDRNFRRAVAVRGIVSFRTPREKAHTDKLCREAGAKDV